MKPHKEESLVTKVFASRESQINYNVSENKNILVGFFKDSSEGIEAAYKWAYKDAPEGLVVEGKIISVWSVGFIDFYNLYIILMILGDVVNEISEKQLASE